MTPDDFAKEFYFDPSTPRAVGYATDLSLVRDKTAIAVSACGQLLSRESKTPSGKWIWLQMQPEQALSLAASILVLAKGEQWPIPPNLLDLVERTSLGLAKPERH